MENGFLTNWKLLEKDFQGVFELDYTLFSATNNVVEPNDELIDKWVKQVVDTLNDNQHENTWEALMSLFNIPRGYANEVKFKEYEVSAIGVRNSTKEHKLYINLNLHLSPSSVLE